jgi:Fungal trichothecene efflux pump (TRI12)
VLVNSRVFKRSHLSRRGNILVIGSTTSVVIGLTWGGVRYPWTSARVLSPLVIGLVGLGVFMIYEIYFCKPPIVSPFAGAIQVLSTDIFQGPHCDAHELDVR